MAANHGDLIEKRWGVRHGDLRHFRYVDKLTPVVGVSCPACMAPKLDWGTDDTILCPRCLLTQAVL